MTKQEKDFNVFLSTDGKFTISYLSEDLVNADLMFDRAVPLFEKMVALMNKHDLKPKRGMGFPPKKDKEWTGDVCPKDGGRLFHILTKTGKDICKCENSKFDFATKTSSGCDFIAWGKNLVDAEKKKQEYLAGKQKVSNFNEEYEG